MTSWLLQVNSSDLPIGPIEKMEAHRKGVLHRAFSLFIFRKREGELQLLLQKRALVKYHSGGLWTNSCCGHPEPGADVAKAAKKRLQEEMGIEADLTSVGTFYYQADVGGGLIEHEFDHLFFGNYEGEIHPNSEEVDGYSWSDFKKIKKQMLEMPEEFTIWFHKLFDFVHELVEKQAVLR
jgi:isopentenyl-diphosphate delta-isomerase